ncbi:MAG TPA: hypothetical protein DCZ91_16335 [Lachnospiraceae bacterium]|nr:hypothetical protein [Lachnospiraceae bacterium]
MRPELYLTIMFVVCIIAFIVSLSVNRRSLKEELAISIKQDISIGQMKDAEKKYRIFFQKTVSILEKASQSLDGH